MPYSVPVCLFVPLTTTAGSSKRHRLISKYPPMKLFWLSG